MFRVVGWCAQAVRSPARSERASGLRNGTPGSIPPFRHKPRQHAAAGDEEVGVAMEVRSRFSGFAGFGRIALVALAAAGCGPGGPEKLATSGIAAGHPKSTAPVRPPAPPTPPTVPVVSNAAPVIGDTVAVGNDGGTVAVSAVEANVSAGRRFSAPAG